MGKNKKKGYRGWKVTLNEVLKAHIKAAANGGKAVSYATQEARRDNLERGFNQLRELGYKLPDVRGFKARHMTALAQHWERQELSPSTIQNRISIFRTFAEWIGKDGMIKDAECYVKNPASVQRHLAAEEDKTWSGQNVDAEAKIKEVSEYNARVGIQLELEYRFGLRVKEAALLRPHGADKGSVLAVSYGTKGGRDRIVMIDTPERRELLDRAKELTNLNDSMIPKDKDRNDYKKWRNYYYYVCRKFGITRKNGLVSHGLRHEYSAKEYKEKTGEETPVKGGKKVNKELDRKARQDIAEQLGHSRYTITSAYIGSRNRRKK